MGSETKFADTIMKRIAGICFAVAFLMAIVLFTNYGREYVSYSTAKYTFMACGALGLFFNLLSFKSGKHSQLFNFLYWSGSIVLFAGLTFQLMCWPHALYIIIAGLAIIGVSFVLPESLVVKKDGNKDILDDSL